VLAYFYGRKIIGWLESDIFEYIGTALFIAAIIGTAVTTIQLVRKSRAHGGPTEQRAA